MKTLTKSEISILRVALENYHSTIENEGRNFTHYLEKIHLEKHLHEIKSLIKKIQINTFLNSAKQ